MPTILDMDFQGRIQVDFRAATERIYVTSHDYDHSNEVSIGFTASEARALRNALDVVINSVEWFHGDNTLSETLTFGPPTYEKE